MQVERRIYLIRHGDSRDTGLTSIGEAQAVHIAECFLKDWNRGSAIMHYSPVARAKQTAAIFSRVTGITSKEDPLLHINTFHDLNAQSAFASQFMNCQAKNIVLIGHDENRKHLDFLAMRLFSYWPVLHEIPLGKMARVCESKTATLVF